MKPFTSILLIFLALPAISFAIVLNQPETIVIEKKSLKPLQCPPVPFQHKGHNSRADIKNCNTCHHIYSNNNFDHKANSVGKPCSSCHRSKGSSLNLKYAYHTQCIGCHEKKNQGPINCAGCHQGYELKQICETKFKHPKRPFARFEHDKHVNEFGNRNCSLCHHLYKRGKKAGYAVVGQKCSDCHLLNMKKRNILNLKDSYHQMCISCHEQKDKGPLACGECHLK